ncbi:hypothetical protein SERLA73DRAFT_71670 [Serpula lacrymans var. lacrymans S7.3]|uniref:DUF6533 domain-containing protein n=1 Tax=Serpula lacrymans var. lacrymans (strain S7.3) TaxID=936435 RepID=F8PS08_SERL3|nr:hypothetical protein SERLA73DRAFT_71670 [Serpula lacrymans var. lacrymans S7.3]
MPFNSSSTEILIPAYEASVIIATLQGKRLFFCTATLMFYDHLITIGQEIEYFWTTAWNLSQILYFGIRYIALFEVILIMIAYSVELSASVRPRDARILHLTNLTSCDGVSRTLVTASNVGLVLTQVIRVWYLFAHSKIVRLTIVLTFVACITCQLILVGWRISAIHLSQSSSTGIPGLPSCGYMPPYYWCTYVPPVVLHVVMYALSFYRLVNITHSYDFDKFVGRFVEEGGPMYFIATVAILLTEISLFSSDVPIVSDFLSMITVSHQTRSTDVHINIELIASTPLFIFMHSLILSWTSLLQATVIVATSHALLSIRTLAAKYNGDVAWVLSYNEMSRLRYKQGPNDGELLVDMDTGDGEGVELVESGAGLNSPFKLTSNLGSRQN